MMISSDIRCNGDGTLMETAAEDTVSEFWQQWQKLQNQLYRCCLKLMNFNPTDAEDALSQAMLKAWSKVQKYAGKINNLKAWLMQLTHNLCIDIIRQRSKGVVGLENMEWVGATEHVDTGSAVDTPEKALEKAEKVTVIQEAIASLPERFRDTFILHFYHQRTHTEIAQAQGITYDNVCKRISLARKQLKEMLSSYFHGIDGDNAQQEPVEEAIALKDCSVVDQKDTGAIAQIESSAEEKSKGAIVNPNPPEMTDEANKQKRSPLVRVNEILCGISILRVSVSPRLRVCCLVSPLLFSLTPLVVNIRSFDVSAVEANVAGAIASLTERLRDTFILHFAHQHSHTEIAQVQGISYDNVCRQISLTPKQLKEKLNCYF
ncbi:MAG: sigma-70 family RNA polymerase sigma factor [Symploca sp. SIO2C1]|nr:sigma-70 family RNA polymerase sigma factor [Symploca sp. SIO2C1]